MLNPLTAAQLDHGLAALRACQILVDAEDSEPVPAPGEVSLRHLAQYCGVSEATILGVERIALAKVARGLRDHGLPPHLADRLCQLIDRPDQPELF